ncbi:hypothetical protein CPB84DRAFT_1162938 [Gymnopilus junonius]|uniref:Uncharacterized protein n=1 Tax=Gymnopilus junonius TaxID=109634 RepID=A0A9P5NLD6_GYMJU|nr:hypothetical protein CPB84DRAFT_1162938 [Gymnopilus junonius]
MLVSKSLLAISYGTVFNGFPRPISRFDVASSIAATVPAGKAGPQYERMARIAGTAIAAGSFGFGAVKLAALVSCHKGHHVPRFLSITTMRHSTPLLLMKFRLARLGPCTLSLPHMRRHCRPRWRSLTQNSNPSTVSRRCRPRGIHCKFVVLLQYRSGCI